jgi:hypothetical protein
MMRYTIAYTWATIALGTLAAPAAGQRGMQQTIENIIALKRLQMQRTALEMEAERQRMLQLQQDAMAQDFARQQQARATLFVIGAQNAAVMLLDTLQIVGEVREAFWNDATPNLVALYNVNGLAEHRDIVEVLLPVARAYRDRRDGFTARLAAILTAFSDSLKLNEQQRVRLLTDAAKAAQPLYARNLLATTEELAATVQPVLAQQREQAARPTIRPPKAPR